MKKSVWLIIVGAFLFLCAIALTVLGVYRIIYIIKTDPFDDTVRYVLKVIGLVGIIFLQIAGYGGAITLLVFGIIFTAKKFKEEPKKVTEPKVLDVPSEETSNDSQFRSDEVKIEEDKLHARNLLLDMKEIKSVNMCQKEVRIKIEGKEYIVLCKDTSEAVSLVSTIKQHSK